MDPDHGDASSPVRRKHAPKSTTNTRELRRQAFAAFERVFEEVGLCGSASLLLFHA